MEIFRGDRRHDQIKQYIERTVGNDHDNDFAKFEKDPIFYLYLRESMSSGSKSRGFHFSRLTRFHDFFSISPANFQLFFNCK